MKTSRINACVCAAIVACALAVQCGRTPAPMAGGASSTEVGSCGIEGLVVDSLSRPVSGSIIRLRPFDYVASNDSASSFWANRNVLSDHAGRYKFDTVKSGRYNVEAVAGESLGLVMDIQIDTAETLRILPASMLLPLVTIEGSNIPIKPDGPEQPSVHAIGLERSASIDSAGKFALKVPYGWTRLELEGVDHDAYATDTIFFTRPGERIAFGPPPEHSEPGKCDSLSCDLQIVREILDGSGLAGTPAESVCLITQNHVSELRLRSKGIKNLSRTVGKLEWLRKIDIGRNLLDSLPSTMGHLQHLEELVADSNLLMTIPAQIGMINSLRRLDLSGNMLLSLPEPVTYLRSLVWLNLSDNKLCNIGEMTAQWADRMDPGWRATQQCQ